MLASRTHLPKRDVPHDLPELKRPVDRRNDVRGAVPFRGGVNAEIAVPFEVEGRRGHICQPHPTTGMIGVIPAGNVNGNLAEGRTGGTEPCPRGENPRHALRASTFALEQIVQHGAQLRAFGQQRGAALQDVLAAPPAGWLGVRVGA